MSRTKSDRRKLSVNHSFFQEGRRYSLSANEYWIAVRAGWLVKSNYDIRTAFVSDKYKAIFNPKEKKWEFVIVKINPVRVPTMTELIMKLSIYAGQPNEWRQPISSKEKAKSINHPVVFILR